MKRLLVAAGMLLLVTGLCLASIHIQTSNTSYLLVSLDRLQETFDKGDYAQCEELARQFVADFDKRTRYFPYFLRHSDLSRIEEIVVPLPVLLEEGDTQHFAAELARCRNQLETLYQVELPLPENIL